MSFLPLQPVKIEPVPWYNKFHTTVDVLRIDKVHPVVSGNKWFKLRYYLQEAVQQGKKAVLTFGGAYSNHILATAAAAKAAGLQSIGVIRGGEEKIPSFTLQEARELGMQLFHSSRSGYKAGLIPEAVYQEYAAEAVYMIPEGGYGHLGAKGAATILNEASTGSYTHIVAACGTGTMAAGLSMACSDDQRIIGIPVLKNHTGLQEDMLALGARTDKLKRIDGYHCGGYAKKTAALLQFMNDFYDSTGLPTDFVYTAKVFYALDDLFGNGYFNKNNRVLVIHSGGLQGNRSLPKGTLIF